MQSSRVEVQPQGAEHALGLKDGVINERMSFISGPVVLVFQYFFSILTQRKKES